MNAATLHATLVGTGDAVAVLLHGLSGSAASVSRYAPGGVACLLVDLPGHDRSPDVGDFSPEDVTRRVAATIAAHAAGFDGIHLIGVSLGAAIARRLATGSGVGAASMTLIRPAHTGAPHPPHLALNLTIARLLEQNPATAQEHLRAHPAFARMLRDSPAAARNLLAKTRPADADAISRRARLLRAGDLWTSGPASPVPALVIAARDDALHPAEIAREWAQELPQGEFVIAPSPDSTGHAALVRELATAHIRSHPATGER